MEGGREGGEEERCGVPQGGSEGGCNRDKGRWKANRCWRRKEGQEMRKEIKK